MEFSHLSVMPNECIEGLNIKPDGVYVDATTGGGGHSYLIAQRLSKKGRLICFDRDDDALAAAGKRLAEFSNITFVKSNFENIYDVLHSMGVTEIDGILFDLGVSSYQLDNAERGFSYMKDAPLDMRMDRSEGISAYDVVNGYDRRELTRIISTYGEERFAPAIAAAIERNRPIDTTLQLAEIIRNAMPAAARREKQHPAKRTFQALRIEVNGELHAEEKAVADAVKLMSKGGRIAVISFHSLEDRIVKQIFAKEVKGCTCPPDFPVCVCGKKPTLKLITKGALVASEKEQIENPRARSAKLRIAERI
ncbi:MAG: 16S rRNA (cytosine(1402)-N(4))-methyltransferase RsmH [Clostridia bacterium]|nr:16S rRNA (cytosine(1402)-N(4))-methyltransferase RsmH [Clostridia bacterium]